MKTKTNNFSFSEFMSFSESLLDSLEAVSNKVEELTDQISTLENVIGDDATEAPVSAEENVEVEETPIGNETAEVSEEVTETPVSDDVEATDEVPESAPAEISDEVSTEESNDAAAIDALSTGDENFSDKYLVVGLKNRPWGNRVITEKEFSEVEHRKLIPTLFSTQAQAQRALTSYNITGENFSIRYNNVKNILNM